MKLEEQVCSLELAQKLKSLGVKQESYFYWSNAMDGTWRVENRAFFKFDRRSDVSAFTVAELGEMLPMVVHGDYDHLIIEKSIQHWLIYYSRDREGCPRSTNHSLYIYLTASRTEADARAKMLIYLIENKLITL